VRRAGNAICPSRASNFPGTTGERPSSTQGRRMRSPGWCRPCSQGGRLMCKMLRIRSLLYFSGDVAGDSKGQRREISALLHRVSPFGDRLSPCLQRARTFLRQFRAFLKELRAFLQAAKALRHVARTLPRKCRRFPDGMRIPRKRSRFEPQNRSSVSVERRKLSPMKLAALGRGAAAPRFMGIMPGASRRIVRRSEFSFRLRAMSSVNCLWPDETL
jgi:hypothetical protein